MGFKGKKCKTKATNLQTSAIKDNAIQNYKDCFMAGRSSNDDQEKGFAPCENCKKLDKDQSARCGDNELKPFLEAEDLAKNIEILRKEKENLSDQITVVETNIASLKDQLKEFEKKSLGSKTSEENLKTSIQNFTDQKRSY